MSCCCFHDCAGCVGPVAVRLEHTAARGWHLHRRSGIGTSSITMAEGQECHHHRGTRLPACLPAVPFQPAHRIQKHSTSTTYCQARCAAATAIGRSRVQHRQCCKQTDFPNHPTNSTAVEAQRCTTMLVMLCRYAPATATAVQLDKVQHRHRGKRTGCPPRSHGSRQPPTPAVRCSSASHTTEQQGHHGTSDQAA